MSNHTFQEVMEIVKTYLTKQESYDFVFKAYKFADEKHLHQKRNSGEPYITHLIEVAYILANLQVGPNTIVAGFLHDTMEDCDVSRATLVSEFGEDIAKLVDAVTKVGQLTERKIDDYEAENHRKIFIAMARDVRVIIIKLADRLHNMRTLDAKSVEKQKKISKETLEVYAPIAHRLGLNTIKNELEDISLRYIEPEKYHQIELLLAKKEEDRKKIVEFMETRIKTMLKEHGIDFYMYGRAKNIYSIYKKMYLKDRQFDEIYDIHALRIITQSDVQCYEILGYIHASYRPIPGRFKDYIAMPKPNLYQSLHTTIIAEDGLVFEIQIRTRKMEEIAERGVAAHWRYKEGLDYDPVYEQREIEEKLHWFRDLISITDTISDDAKEYMDSLQKDIFEANVYVFTPKGRVIDLPNGSTPIDFAYKIHTQVGHSMIGAIVNGVLSPLSTVLKTGDVVDIRTSKTNVYPNEGWLKITKTNYARNHIRKALLKRDNEQNKEENLANGKQMLEDALREVKLELKDVYKVIDDSKFLDSTGFKEVEDLFVGFVHKAISPTTVVDKIVSIVRPYKPTLIPPVSSGRKIEREMATNKEGIIVPGIDSIAVSLAQCCTPIPGDDIIGYISKGLGVKVHRRDCSNILKETHRLIEVKWDLQVANKSLHNVELVLIATDRPNLLVEVMNTLNQQKVVIRSVNANVNSQYLTATISINILVNDFQHYQLLTNILMTNVSGILEIRRVSKN